MNTKYEFVEGDAKQEGGRTLHRIRALVAIGLSVSAGDLGGYIEAKKKSFGVRRRSGARRRSGVRQRLLLANWPIEIIRQIHHRAQGRKDRRSRQLRVLYWNGQGVFGRYRNDSRPQQNRARTVSAFLPVDRFQFWGLTLCCSTNETKLFSTATLFTSTVKRTRYTMRTRDRAMFRF